MQRLTLSVLASTSIAAVGLVTYLVSNSRTSDTAAPYLDGAVGVQGLSAVELNDDGTVHWRDPAGSHIEIPLGMRRTRTFSIISNCSETHTDFSVRSHCDCTKATFSPKVLEAGDRGTLNVVVAAGPIGGTNSIQLELLSKVTGTERASRHALAFVCSSTSDSNQHAITAAPTLVEFTGSWSRQLVLSSEVELHCGKSVDLRRLSVTASRPCIEPSIQKRDYATGRASLVVKLRSPPAGRYEELVVVDLHLGIDSLTLEIPVLVRLREPFSVSPALVNLGTCERTARVSDVEISIEVADPACSPVITVEGDWRLKELKRPTRTRLIAVVCFEMPGTDTSASVERGRRYCFGKVHVRGDDHESPVAVPLCLTVVE